MKFKKLDTGDIVVTEEDLQAAMNEAGEKAVEALIKKCGLDKAPTPPITPAAEPGKEFAEPAQENKYQKLVRLEKASLAISGGTLAIEHAPKELRFNRFLKAMRMGDMATVQALSGGKALTTTGSGGADGGYLVPIEFGTELKVAMETYGAIGDCTRHDMVTNEKQLRSVTAKPTIYQVDELVQPTESATKFGKPILDAKKFAGIQVISEEEFEDNNVGLFEKLQPLFAEGFGARQSQELFIGTTFSGILGQATAKITAMASSSILQMKYKELVNLNNSLSKGQLVGGGKYYMHRTIWGLIQGISDQQERPIVMNPWDDKNATLFGRPVVLDEQMPDASQDAANKGFIVFGNLMWCDFGMRKDITAKILTESSVVTTGGTVNLGAGSAVALRMTTRWGINVSLPQNIAVLATKANS